MTSYRCIELSEKPMKTLELERKLNEWTTGTWRLVQVIEARGRRATGMVAIFDVSSGAHE